MNYTQKFYAFLTDLPLGLLIDHLLKAYTHPLWLLPIEWYILLFVLKVNLKNAEDVAEAYA